MSEPKFTPGPWRLDIHWPNLYIRHEGVGWPLGNVQDGADHTLCLKQVMDVGSGFHPRELRLANAHLIAAAPEMYAELKRICDICATHGGRDPKSCAEAGCNIDNILKKARGEG